MKNTVVELKFDEFKDDNGILVAYQEYANIPFELKRVFIVKAGEGDVRGDHAHKTCSQILVCTSGGIEVSYDDSLNVKTCFLNSPGSGLLIPPGNWATQKFLYSDSVLMVLCDEEYDHGEYIFDYEEFKNFVRKSNG